MLLVECGFKFYTPDSMYGMHFIVSGGSYCWMPLPTVSSYIRTCFPRWVCVDGPKFSMLCCSAHTQWLFLEGHFGYFNLAWLNKGGKC